MVEITTFMQQREYVKAHDAYIRCAIGTAPWPMGITGTGIHERQGRQHLRECKARAPAAHAARRSRAPAAAAAQRHAKSLRSGG